MTNAARLRLMAEWQREIGGAGEHYALAAEAGADALESELDLYAAEQELRAALEREAQQAENRANPREGRSALYELIELTICSAAVTTGVDLPVVALEEIAERVESALTQTRVFKPAALRAPAEAQQAETVTRLREALVKVRAHTAYAILPEPQMGELLRGLLASIERIVDAALSPAGTAKEGDRG